MFGPLTLEAYAALVFLAPLAGFALAHATAWWCLR